MPNDYFQFKQFIIHQDKCAMKVCTDACVFGAWTAKKTSSTPVKNILDIGCGTGLLSLMLAQSVNAEIDAVEIDPDAAEQARKNIAATIWKGRVHVINSSLQNFIPAIKYDLIISNPPFFENDLHSPDKNKNTARHDTTLTLEEILSFIKRNLSDEGHAFILLPFHRTVYFEELVKINSLFVQEKLLLKQSPRHSFFRTIIKFGKRGVPATNSNELIIHDNNRIYTEEFVELLKDYYLKL